jgi:hypothetical protein
MSEVATPQLFRTIDERNVNRFGSDVRHDACPQAWQRMNIEHSRHDHCFHTDKIATSHDADDVIVWDDGFVKATVATVTSANAGPIANKAINLRITMLKN